eukprot:CAMPEP_0180013282 /NCGR_PEP_ID=MMETSP0984-20121128/17423_1 /TAXON_ID=483367 /ORGANISM="non described non described, Strain CCMP 2436" /LENGTH=301 /DNA_ID=CAMNT_0021935605 /DNA_START=1 /DNA_END=906 /DNA_ORIENTATION=+
MSRRFDIAAALIAVIFGCMGYVIVSTSHPPSVDPLGAVDPASPRPLVIALGDSLTHGLFSHAWLADLKHAYPHLQFANTAMNGHTSHTVLQTARSLKLHRPPAVVLVLVGSNDALYSLSPKARDFYMEQGKLPVGTPAGLPAALAAYERNLGDIITHARKQVEAKEVIIISPPPFGGNVTRDLPSDSFLGALEHSPHDAVKLMARKARHVAWRRGATFIDLHELIDKRLREQTDRGPPFVLSVSQFSRQFFVATIVSFIPGLTFNRMSHTLYSHDWIHLNQRGAQVIADALKPILGRIRAA